ncbi:MAG: OmpA family protein [Bacteroidetes bacterium]|nr:OmpA family protein [Bacteroidota bacterium]
MKKFTFLLFLVILGFANVTLAQDAPAGNAGYFKFQARLKIGMGQTFTALPLRFEDMALIGHGSSVEVTGLKNNVLKTKWGIYAGGNFDFYFHPNFGAGLDVDYFANSLKFVTPATLKDYVNTHANTSISESNRKNQSLIFIGVGPSFKVFTNEKWDVDVNLRGGVSMLNMGSLMVKVNGVMEDERYPRDTVLDFNYDKTLNVFGAKLGVYGNYWFNPFIGISLGFDFIHSFVSAKKINDDADMKFAYKDPENFLKSDGTLDGYPYFQPKNYLDKYHPKMMNVNHFSASVGVVFRVVPVPKPKGKNKDIIVLVKDSLTSIPVADVDVTLRDSKGSVLRTKKTESNGKVTFENVEPGDYLITGAKGELKTSSAKVEKSEFNKKKSIYKELVLKDLKFMLAGVTVQCKNGDKPIGKVNIELTNKNTGKVETAASDEQGKFSFNLEQETDYSIVGNKDGYFSGLQEITTKGLDRSKTLYVKLVLCVEELKPDQIFVLPIYYDFDKCNIRKDAGIELDRLVDLMRKYPKMEIELSSHTDQRGTDAYNDKLSQCRAQSAVDYIIGKGISKDRITAKGYGKHKLIEDCTKVAGCPTGSAGDCPCHQLNRRTEVKILKM